VLRAACVVWLAMSSDKLEQFKVHKIQELKRQNRREQARDILERVSKQVQPILRKREWTVPLLREFLPKNPNLLV
jgi:DNA-dependent metalloprotease WSS1